MKPNWVSLFCWGMIGAIVGSISGVTWWHWLAIMVAMLVNDNAKLEEGRMSV